MGVGVRGQLEDIGREGGEGKLEGVRVELVWFGGPEMKLPSPPPPVIEAACMEGCKVKGGRGVGTSHPLPSSPSICTSPAQTSKKRDY